MPGNNEKKPERAVLEDHEAGQVTGGNSLDVSAFDPRDNTGEGNTVDGILLSPYCTRCGAEGHTDENCPNFGWHTISLENNETDLGTL